MTPLVPGGGHRAVFDQRGHRYDDAMRRFPEARAEEFAFVVDLARPAAGETVIDIPAGGGYLAEHLPDGVAVVSVETTLVFAERARSRHVDAVVDDLFGSGLPAHIADVVVSIAGLHHGDDHHRALSGWRRLLRRGGRLVAADVAAGSAEARFLDEVGRRWTTTDHDGTYFGDDLAEVVAAAGYEQVEVVDGRYHWWADDEPSLVAFCTGLFGLVDVSPDQVLEALVEGPGIDRSDDGRVGLRWGLRAATARAPR